jgi:hypothetical protein
VTLQLMDAKGFEARRAENVDQHRHCGQPSGQRLVS